MGYGIEHRVATWCGAFVAASLVLTSTARSEPAACQMLQVNELPVTMQGNQPLVEVEVNGQPAKMLIDTGSVLTTLFPSAAARLGLSAAAVDSSNFGADVKFYGVGGGGRPGVVRLQTLKIGSQETRNTNIFVSGRAGSFGGADGLLGRQYLLQSDLEFDLKHNAIRFFKPKNCAGDQVLYWGGGYTVVPMRSTDVIKGVDVFVALNGVNIAATLDSGAYNTVVTTSGAAAAGARRQSWTSIGESGGVGPKRVATYSAVFQSFGFGDEMIKNASLAIADLYQHDKEVFVGSHIPTSLIDTTQMLLGADFLKSHRVYIARSQGRVYASYVGGPVFDPPRADVTAIKPAPTP